MNVETFFNKITLRIFPVLQSQSLYPDDIYLIKFISGKTRTIC